MAGCKLRESQRATRHELRSVSSETPAGAASANGLCEHCSNSPARLWAICFGLSSFALLRKQESARSGTAQPTQRGLAQGRSFASSRSGRPGRPEQCVSPTSVSRNRAGIWNPTAGQQIALPQRRFVDGSPERFHDWLLFVQVVSQRF